MKFRNRPDILISLIAVKARFELLTFITKQKLIADFTHCVKIVEVGLFQRVYRASGLKWRSGVVLHDSS